jgi:hypothetical protein
MPGNEDLPFCACGCGERVSKKGNKWIHNHNWTGSDNTYRDKQKKKRIQYFEDHPEVRDEQSEMMFKLHADNPEWGEQQSIRVKKRFDDPEERRLASEKEIQRYIDNPELREELSKKKIQYYKDHPESVELMSRLTTQYFIDHPEAREDASRKSIEQWSHQENRDEASRIRVQFFIDHPEAREKMSEDKIQYYKDHPEIIEEMSKIRTEFYNDLENRERASAAQMDQDYDAGEWTGFYVGDRLHVKSERICEKLNERFNGCEMHHVTPSLVVYIPKELHRHYIPHSLKTGLNMDIINIVALQYLNGCYNG